MSIKATPKAFVYVEAQAAVPFSEYPWQADGEDMKQQPGLLTKTWLSGVGNQSVGGFYSFDRAGTGGNWGQRGNWGQSRLLVLDLPEVIASEYAFDANRRTRPEKVH